ncbi:hypothetical protein KM043_003683 [Ampulex compressa]|nr:hypothetical protein KM043_003683 [Ampulex compressa]
MLFKLGSFAGALPSALRREKIWVDERKRGQGGGKWKIFRGEVIGQRFLGNESHVEHFKLLERATTSILIGARNAIYNISLHDLTEIIDQGIQSQQDPAVAPVARFAEERRQNRLSIILYTGGCDPSFRNAYLGLLEPAKLASQINGRDVARSSDPTRCPGLVSAMHTNATSYLGYKRPEEEALETRIKLPSSRTHSDISAGNFEARPF